MADPLVPEKSGNSKAAQVRIAMLKAVSVGGQRAHDLRIGPQPAYVAADRSDLNRVLIEPQTGTQLRAICEQRRSRRETARAMKSSAAVGVAGIITFGHEAQRLFERLTPAQQDAAYRETAEAVAARLNSSLTGLVVHADESAPHAHFQMPAFDMTGHPVSETAKRGALRDLQTITAEVMGRHAPGIERGRSRIERLKAGASYAETVNRAVRELHYDLPVEIAARKAELEVAMTKLVAAQASVDEMQARVDKLHAKERDLTAAEAKRLATYEKRLADRQAEVAAAESAVETARDEADRLAGIAADAKRSAESARAEQALAEAAKAEADQIAADRLAAADRDATAIRENAAASADAAAAAFSALAVQIRDGTIAQSESGKILSPDASALRPGGAALADVARTMIALTDDMKASRDAAEKTRLVAEEELAQVRSMRATLSGLIDRVKAFLNRPDVSRYAKVSGDGRNMTADIMDQMRKIDAEQRVSPAKKPVPEADSGDKGAGFGEP